MSRTRVCLEAPAATALLPGAEHLSEEKLAVLGPPPVCTACIRHFKAALLLQAVTSAVAETNPLAGGNRKGHRFVISDLLVSFSPCSEVLVQPWLKDFIHSFLSSYFPFPHCRRPSTASSCEDRHARAAAGLHAALPSASRCLPLLSSEQS